MGRGFGAANSVTVLEKSISNPPTQAEVQAIATEIDALIEALRR